jgi:inner membrane protein
MRPWWLLALCYIGALTHPYLDLLTTYSVQLFSIASSRWWHADGLFIIDIWLWLLLAGAIGWSIRREQHGGDWQRPPRVAIAIALAYIALNLGISARADADVRRISPGATRIFASPPPVFSWRRDLVWQEGSCYRRASFSPFTGMTSPGPCEPSNMSDPLVRAAIRQSPVLQKFLRWSVTPQATVSRRRCIAQVSIGDARYGGFGKSRLARQVTLRTCRDGAA